MKNSAILLVAFALPFGVKVLAGDAKKDLDKLQGTWVIEKDNKKGFLKFTGEKFAFEIPDEKQFHRGVIKLNPEASPKEIDMIVKESSKENHQGKTALAIYELKGDTLRWCANAPGKDGRPKEFSEKFLLLEMRREKQ